MKIKQYTRIILIWIVLVLISGVNNVKAQTVADDPHMGIIPAPASVTRNPGTFVFSQKTLIKSDRPKDRSVTWFKNYLSDNQNFHNSIAKYTKSGGSSKGSTIVLTSRGAEKLSKEGYK